MAKIQVSTFQGIAPRIDPRLLDPAQGQIGENLRLTSKALQSWRGPVEVDNPLRAGLLKTIYLYKGTGSDLWLTWTTDVDVVKAPLSNDTTNRLYWTGDGKPKAGDNADSSVTGIDATGGTGIYPENSITLGFPAPTTAPTVVANPAGTDPVDKLYVYTFVSFWGEESAPSPASAIVSVNQNDGGSVDISAMEITVPAEYNTLSNIRIYRSNVGTNQAAYQFVAEIAVQATYTDSIVDSALGEIIEVSDFDLPPTDMFGLLDFGNGILVGFTEYEVCFSEPFQPHAWPIKYRLAVVDKIIGGGVFGNTLVVCTDDRPVLVVGNHPSTMTMTLHPNRQACVAKQSIVSMRNSVVYASPNGLYQIGYGGASLLTEPLYDRETWQQRNPAQLRSSYWDTRYIGFTDDKGIVIETANNIISAADFNIDVDSIYTDPENETLYICQTIDSVNTISRFNAGGTRISYKWRSKKFSLGSQATLTAVKILAKYGDLYTADEIAQLAVEAAAVAAANVAYLTRPTGALNEHAINVFDVNGSLIDFIPKVPTEQNVVLKLYADGAQIGQTTHNNDEPQRLPSGERYRQYEIEIETFTDVNQITLASSVQDLHD